MIIFFLPSKNFWLEKKYVKMLIKSLEIFEVPCVQVNLCESTSFTHQIQALFKPLQHSNSTEQKNLLIFKLLAEKQILETLWLYLSSKTVFILFTPQGTVTLHSPLSFSPSSHPTLTSLSNPSLPFWSLC